MHIILPKTRAYVKNYDGQTEWVYFLIEDDEFLKKCNTIWHKVSPDIKHLIASLYIIQIFWKSKQSLMVMKLQIFMIKKVLMWIFNDSCLAVISLDSSLKKDENSYLQVFLKECKYINLFRMGIQEGGGKKVLLPKICHTYPTMMKLDTFIRYPKKIKKIYESHDTLPDFCWHQNFLSEISKFCYIKK